MGLYPSTLTQFTTASTEGWSGTAPPGGNGSILFNPSHSTYTTNSSFAWKSGTPITVSFWTLVPSTSTSGAFTIGNQDSGGALRIQAHVPYSDGVLYWDHGGFGSPGRLSTSFSSYLGLWTHVVLQAAGAAANWQAIYLNGLLANSTTSSAYPASDLTGLWVGQMIGIYYYKGNIDSFRVYDRVLSAAEVRSLYDEERSGSPGVLNRVNPLVFLLSGSVAPSSAISDTDFSPSSQNNSYISSVVNGIDLSLYLDYSNIISNLIFYDSGSYSDSIPNLAASYSGTDSASSSDTPGVSSFCLDTDSGLYSDSVPSISISSWSSDSTSGVDISIISASFATADSASGLESPGSVLSVVLLVSTDSSFTVEQIYSILNAIVASNDSCSLVEVLSSYTAIQSVMLASDSGITASFANISATVSFIDAGSEIEGWILSTATPVNVVATDSGGSSGGSSEGWVVVTTVGPSSWPAAMYFGM